MVRRQQVMSVGFVVAVAAVMGCGVRGADATDLTTQIEKQPVVADSGIAPGSDGTRRLDTYVCTTPPPPAAPTMMVEIPAGPFLMGCNSANDNECKKDELPPHMVTLKAYSIDVTEVSQLQYYECVKAGICLPPTCDWDPCGARADYPVVCVARADAGNYCVWKEQHLPTEAEWEKAARGPDGLKYPWGNDGIDCTRTNMAGCKAGSDGKDGTSKVGSHPAGASPYGVLDMAGNAVEWVADFYDESYYATSPAEDPTGPTKAGSYVGRGGGWRSVPYWHRASTRDEYEPTYFKNSGGFRCAN